MMFIRVGKIFHNKTNIKIELYKNIKVTKKTKKEKEKEICTHKFI